MRRALPSAFLLLPLFALGQAKTLPITNVSLYKNGVGFFEHAGRVTGSEAVTIDFTTGQLNDVLQSLTAVDLGGGRIGGAGYNSTTPLEQQLKTLSLGLPAETNMIELFTALRGTRVAVAGSGAPFAGRIVNIETHKTVAAKEAKEQAGVLDGHFLTVASETGEIRVFQVTPALSVRLLDTATHTDLTQYLKILDSNREQGLRHLTLQDNGEGTRELHVSYISEVPVWKSTYRILFTGPAAAGSAKQTATLQGWSVVDNTTGSDWLNVHLALIAGAPQSFIQPISTPYYSRRPEIPLPEEAQLTPQTHDSGEEPNPLAAPKVAGVAGMGSMGGSAARVLRDEVKGGYKNFVGGPMASSETVTVNAAPQPYETSAAETVEVNTTTRAFDDFFEYKIAQPITIRKNESALVPILQTKVDAERVTLWSPQQPTALRALWITNTSNLTLDRGSFTIVEDGSFGGEGLLDPIHPAERRLLSYAADQAVRVTTANNHNSRRVQRLSIAKGVLKESTMQVEEVEYVVKNAAPEARTVVVEHPVREGWTLDSDPKPVETTPSTYRFRVETKPGETVRLHLSQHQTLDQLYRLANINDAQLVVLLQNDHASPALLAQLEPVFAAKRALASIDEQIQAKQQAVRDITNDQKRLRDNLTALKGSVEERTLAKRYTEELNAQEDQLAALNKDLVALKQQRLAAQEDLNRKIEGVSLEEAV